MAPFTMASGTARAKKVMAYNFGKMDLNMKESGQTIKQMAKENSTTLTETSMRASGLMTGLMGTGHIRILKDLLVLKKMSDYVIILNH